MTDAVATARDDNTTTFSVQGDWGRMPMTVNYEIGLSSIQHGTTLTDQYVKVAMSKDGTYVKGSASTGVTIQSFASTAGTLSGTTIADHYVTNGTLQNEGTVEANHNLADEYVVRDWVSDAYDLPTNASQSDTENEGNLAIAQQDGSASHKKTSGAETYSFKVKVYALQA